MRTKFPLLIVLLAWTALTGGKAQDLDLSQIPPPTAPFVAHVPDDADWIIAVQYPSDAVAPTAKPPAAPGADAPADRRIRQVHTTKTGKFKRDLINYVNGKTEERWFIGICYLWNTGEHVAVTDLSSLPFNTGDTSPSMGSGGYPGVRWIGLNYYDKVVVYQNVPSYHYKNTSAGFEAWIDVKTQLPVGYKDGEAVYQYTFNPPPTSPLTLPAAYEEAWEKLQKMYPNRY